MMKKILFTLALSLLFSGWQAPASTAQAAELQTQVIPLNNRTLPRNGVRIPFLQINLRAVGGPVEINGLVVGRSGLSTSDDFGRIWAETSNYRRTTSRQLTNDDRVELEFRSPLVVSTNENQRLTVYANLEFEDGGRTASLNLLSIDHNGQMPQVEINLRNNLTSSETTTQAEPVKMQVPVFTESKSKHDRTQFKIQCHNQVCQLVPRS